VKDRPSRSSFVRNLAPLTAAALIVFTARASLADHYRVPTGSMEPTVHVGDHIVVSKIAYGLRIPLTDRWLVSFSSPARGDVVVLDPPDDPESQAEESGAADVLLKRVVALGGETVEVRGGIVYIDGRRVEERWASVALGAGPDFGPQRVPQGKLLVLGDNRGNSRDGRYFGFVDVHHVLGRALAVIARDGRPRYAPL
jgi:signal peptidase I